MEVEVDSLDLVFLVCTVVGCVSRFLVVGMVYCSVSHSKMMKGGKRCVVNGQ